MAGLAGFDSGRGCPCTKLTAKATRSRIEPIHRPTNFKAKMKDFSLQRYMSIRVTVTLPATIKKKEMIQQMLTPSTQYDDAVSAMCSLTTGGSGHSRQPMGRKYAKRRNDRSDAPVDIGKYRGTASEISPPSDGSPISGIDQNES